MKNILIILMLVSCTPLFSADKTPHKHDNRSHSHILPAQGMNHTHNGAKPKPKSRPNQENVTKVLKAINSVVIACFSYSSDVADRLIEGSSHANSKIKEAMKKIAIEEGDYFNKLCLKNAAFKLNQAAKITK